MWKHFFAMKAVFFSSLCYRLLYFLIIYCGYASAVATAVALTMPLTL